MATILIVDDDKFTRNVLQTIFAQDKQFAELDVHTLTAGDGEEGVAMFREHRPEIVITDLLMPKLDGFELCKAVRGEQNGAAVDLFVASGVYRDSQIQQRLRNDYNAKFFAKPYQIRDLTAAVAKVLHSRATGKRPVSDKVSKRATTGVAAGDDAEHAGDLATTPLATVLMDLYDQRATGKLLIERGRVSKTIDVVLGHPIGATSTAREETLGYFLAQRGVITDEVHQRALELAARDKVKLGQVLVKLGALDSKQLLDQLALQVRHKIVRSLRWPDGSWKFTAGPAGDDAGHPIDLELLVLQGLRTTASVAEAHRRAAALQGKRAALTKRGNQLWPRAQRVLGEVFASAFTDGALVGDMLAREEHRVDLSIGLDCLLQCGAVEIQDAGDVTVTSTFVQLADKSDDVLSVSELSEQSARFRARPTAADRDELYAMLFGDDSEDSRVGALPLVADESAVPDEVAGRESGVIDVSGVQLGAAGAPQSEQARARRAVLEEYLRVQGCDHYEALRVPPAATAQQISGAVVERQRKFAPEYYARFDLGRDHGKLEEILRRYEVARATLLDDRKRRAYDQELAGGELAPSAPSLDAEIAFRAARTMMDRGDYTGAISKLNHAIKLSPDEPDYHAALGWAHFMRGGRGAHAADAARPHINHALSLNPDHALAHEYKGLVSIAIGGDIIEAIAHLELALDGDPTRAPAIEALAAARRQRGELRPLERKLRHVLHRCAGGGHGKVEQKLWVALAELYRELDDLANARVAFESALRISPNDSALKAALADVITGADGEGFFARSDDLRRRWRDDPTQPAPGHQLFAMAVQAGRSDVAFLVASALVARGQAPEGEDADAYYRRYRPKFVVRAQQPLDDALWDRLRHPDDDPAVGRLFDLLAPVIAEVAPLSADDLEIDDTTYISDDDLPADFRRVRAYVARVLGVPAPVVHMRTDFGHQIHVGALGEPVLLVGDDALAAPERLELAFRIGRAMTYVPPARALGGSRPARQLKSAMLGALASAIDTTRLDPGDALAAATRDAVAALAADHRDAVHELVKAIAARSRTINLSQWQRALSRTADRAGLLLCGDLPAAIRFLRDMSAPSDAVAALIDFAVGLDHCHLREHLGLSVDV